MLRWQKGDYVRLGRAVAEFNREISKNVTEANKLYLPEKVNYRELRDRIQTREGLNAYIQGLKRIKLEGAFELEKIKSGEIITKYQRRELERGRAQAVASLEQELATEIKATKIRKKIADNEDLHENEKSQKILDIEAKISDYKNLFNLKGEAFKKEAFKLGINQTELKYHRAYTFKKTYLRIMRDQYSNYEDYWLFKKWVNKHKNPVNFYNALPDEEFYPNDIQYQSDNVLSQDDFKRFLEILGVDVDKEWEKAAKRRGISVDAYKKQIRAEIQEKESKRKISKQ